jgi:outer membrane biogenesis lipoprotein LolB
LKKKPDGHPEDCECDQCADVDKIDYYEIEAQVKMIQADQRKAEGLHWNTVKKQYGIHIRENFMPKPSQKKKIELEMALRDRKMPFARFDAHLPMEGMF